VWIVSIVESLLSLEEFQSVFRFGVSAVISETEKEEEFQAWLAGDSSPAHPHTQNRVSGTPDVAENDDYALSTLIGKCLKWALVRPET
jgi:hypothetical protein